MDENPLVVIMHEVPVGTAETGISCMITAQWVGAIFD
jgi:hypothetical protein